MLRLLVAAALVVAAAAPAFACEFNKSAAAGSTTAVSQSHSAKSAQNSRS